MHCSEAFNSLKMQVGCSHCKNISFYVAEIETNPTRTANHLGTVLIQIPKLSIVQFMMLWFRLSPIVYSYRIYDSNTWFS